MDSIDPQSQLTTYHIHNGVDSPLIDKVANGLVGAGSGSVTTVSVVSANGVSGTVANPTTTPAITLALGGITPTSITASGQIVSTQHTTTVSVNWNTGNVQYIQLASGNNTFSFSNPLSGGRYMLILKQPGSGAAGTVTWPTISWVGNTAPTLTAINNKVDIITFVYDGVNAVYFGNYSQNY